MLIDSLNLKLSPYICVTHACHTIRAAAACLILLLLAYCWLIHIMHKKYSKKMIVLSGALAEHKYMIWSTYNCYVTTIIVYCMLSTKELNYCSYGLFTSVQIQRSTIID